ncbi:MAG: hypothetical protein HYX54_08765 [Chloroflexi bacterium]|nr:hypothetical protein [Chloroflexota bacterium]
MRPTMAQAAGLGHRTRKPDTDRPGRVPGSIEEQFGDETAGVQVDPGADQRV